MNSILRFIAALFQKNTAQQESQRLQSQFDLAIQEVENLMAKGDIKASGEALLKAEALRKQITALNPKND